MKRIYRVIKIFLLKQNDASKSARPRDAECDFYNSLQACLMERNLQRAKEVSTSLGKFPEEPLKIQKATPTTNKRKEKKRKEKGFESN